MPCQPVFIDGPLLGKRYPVDELAIRHGLRIPVPPDIPVADFWTLAQPVALEFSQVHYTFHRVALFGRILVVGTTLSISSQEAGAAAFEALTNDAAKDAVVEVLAPAEPAQSAPLPPAEPSSQLSPSDALRLIDQAIAEQADFARPPRQRIP